METTLFGNETQAYFPVSLQPVFVGEGASQVPEYQAVVREDTGTVLGIHRGGYKLVPNRAVFEPFEEAIVSSGLDREGIEVKEGIAYAGRTVVREYYFPHLTVEPRVGDVVEFTLRVLNSYDATNAFRVLMAGRRRLCLNGLIGAERSASVYARHTAGFSAERAVDGIKRAFERYLALDAEWKRWAGRSITPLEAHAVFEAMPGSNPRRLERLEKYWAIEAQLAGESLWGLYNTLTYWSTHAPIRKASAGNRAAIVLERETLVQRALGTPVFQRLVA
ncbi:MAG: DUF932 domain-containing protein [Gammaproteobacteria bacterium]